MAAFYRAEAGIMKCSSVTWNNTLLIYTKGLFLYSLWSTLQKCWWIFILVALKDTTHFGINDTQTQYSLQFVKWNIEVFLKAVSIHFEIVNTTRDRISLLLKTQNRQKRFVVCEIKYWNINSGEIHFQNVDRRHWMTSVSKRRNRQTNSHWLLVKDSCLFLKE